MVEGFNYECIIQSNLSSGISFNWIGWVIDEIVIEKAKNSILSPIRTSFVRCWSGATAVERAQERTKAPLSKSKRERERFPGILIPAGASHSFFTPTAYLLWRTFASAHKFLSFYLTESGFLLQRYRDCSQENLCAMARCIRLADDALQVIVG